MVRQRDVVDRGALKQIMNNRKVFVIGIDGGTFDIILPMIKRGELPTIASIMEKGVWGNLSTTIPSVTVPAWISCVTGMNPGNYGLFYFTGNSHFYDEGCIQDATKVKTKSIWHLLSDHQKKSIIVNVPFTVPPANIHGVMVALRGLTVGSSEKLLSTHPPELEEHLIKSLFLDEAIREFNKFGGAEGQMTKEVALNRRIELGKVLTKKTKEICLQLLKNHHDTDFFMSVFRSTDWLQHYFLGYTDPHHPLYTDELFKRYGDVIQKEYQRVDAAIKDILKEVKDATIILLSDHGGGPLYNFFYANVWLRKNGYLEIIGNRTKPSFMWEKISLTKCFSKIGVKTEVFKNLKIPVLRAKSKPAYEEIDWMRTRAYAAPIGININLKGREPCGSVDEVDYNSMCETIRNELYQLKNHQGREIIDKVYRREEIYSGPYVNEAPDIIYLFKDTHYVPRLDVFYPSIFQEIPSDTIVTGQHISSKVDGIIMMQGPDIKPGSELSGAHIMDITPTILYLMGLPIPENMDGRILTEFLQEEFIAKNPPIYSGPSELPHWENEGMSQEEENMIKNQLKQLGYLS
ncbi:MAG: alkaline phosphatase family protein [Candidatus Brocadiaceae bacterium]|nr:alkaline phosphatase family protein [Candidatus Brocadiaceae bacterium]